MTEITCPICGKENNEHAAECLYCGAVLNPSLHDTWRRSSPESMDDILASLRGENPVQQNLLDEPVDQPAPEEPTSTEGTEELSDSDFLDRLRDLANEQPAASLGLDAEAGSESLPDWLKELDAWQPVEGSSEPQEPAQESPDQPVFSIEETALPSWLNVPDVSESEAVEETGPTADLVSEGLTEPGPDEQAENEPAAESEFSFASIPGLEPELPVEASHSDEDESLTEEEAPSRGLAEWLALQQTPSETGDDLSEPAENEPETIHGLPPAESASDEPESAVKQPEEKPLPDWLRGVVPDANVTEYPGVKEVEFPAESKTVSASEAEDLTEWLGNLQSENFPLVFDLGESQPAPSSEQPVDHPESEPISIASPDVDSPEPLTPATPPFVNGDLSAWLTPTKEQGGQEPISPIQDEDISPAETLPPWMQEIAAETAEKALEPPDTVKETAQEKPVPDWLAGLKPTAGISPEMPDALPSETVETNGPLAGIPGVLPIIHAASSFRKAPVYSSEVLVSEKQAAYTAKLETMLADENQVTRKKRSQRPAPYGIFRALVGLLLVAVMLVPMFPGLSAWLPVQLETTAFSGVSEIAAFQSAISGLDENATVLVAMEYAAGYAGELNPTASAVLQELMKRNARIAVVSTNPSGLLLAEGVRTDALNAQPRFSEQYTQRDWFINLGYLPGETLSLHELASDLPQAVQYGISAGLENRPVWDSTGLLNVQKLADFSMLILITDTAETGRAWMEQVQPLIPQMPLLMATSAQAAPMLQPYVESGQAAAMITGLTGGWNLNEDIAADVSGADEQASSAMMFRLGTAVIILLILIGVLFEILRAVFVRKQLDREAS